MSKFNLGRLLRGKNHHNSNAAAVGYVERRKRHRYMPEQGTRILIVDDSKVIIVALRKMLHQAGYTVLEAGNGKRAIDVALAEQPQLILMDVVMPGINGFQATRALRSEESSANTPIIIMSGDEQATAQFWGKKLGANDFMLKPFTRADVFFRIEKLLYEAQHTE